MKKRALVMLTASLAIIEAACSHSPAPTPPTEVELPDKIYTRIYTTDGTMYVTSRYAVTDSFVVIQELLRDNRFYPDDESAHLYNHTAVNKPPANIDIPVMLPVHQVVRMEPWKESHKTRNGVLAAGLIFGGIVVALVIWVNSIDFGTYE